MPDRSIAHINGDSTRVGAVRHLAALDIDRKVEIDTNAHAICWEEECNWVKNGEGGLSVWDLMGTVARIFINAYV
jgi:hypothetical protein